MKALATIAKKITTSTSLMLVVMVLVASAFFGFIYKEPVDFIQVYSKRISVIKNYIESKKRADIVLLGSSLMLNASYNSDISAIEFKKDKSYYMVTYTDSKYFEKLLAQKSNNNLVVKNLSFIASTPADIELLVSGMVENHIEPKTIIYGVAPRMMADNLTPNKGSIGGPLVLNLKTKTSSDNKDLVSNLRNILLSNPQILVLARDYALIADRPNFDQTMDFIAGKLWYFYGCRTTVKTEITKIADRTLNRLKNKINPEGQKEASIESPSTESKLALKNISKHPNPEKFEIDLNHYNSCYNPPNFKKFELNCRLMEKIASLCQQKNIDLILVQMPLTEENRALLSNKLDNAYTDFLNSLTQKYPVKLIDLSNGFPITSFDDSVHLNGKGSMRFFDDLSSELIRRQIVQKKSETLN